VQRKLPTKWNTIAGTGGIGVLSSIIGTYLVKGKKE
jgi:hypothetical protein